MILTKRTKQCTNCNEIKPKSDFDEVLDGVCMPCQRSSCPPVASQGNNKLCPGCNSALQDFKDDIELLEDAISYLKKSKIFRLS